MAGAVQEGTGTGGIPGQRFALDQVVGVRVPSGAIPIA